jgi:energy-coupling factor transport system substrate-specific component
MTAGARTRKIALVVANVLGVAAFVWPFLLPAAVGGATAREMDAPLIFAGLVVCLGVLLFLELGRGGMGPKAVALIAVLAAAMVALRLPGFVGGFSALFVVVLVAGNAFGPAFGFVLGATGTLASGLFVGGVGPWLPFQMVAIGWVGAGAGLVPRPRRWSPRIAALAAYGFVVGFAFGALMNLWFWPFAAFEGGIGWAPELGGAENLRRYLSFYAVTSAGWDAFRAVGNAVAIVVVGKPLLASLDRAARRMRLDVAPEWGHPSTARHRSGDAERGMRNIPERGMIEPKEESAGRPRSGLGRAEESPDSAGQDAGQDPRRGDPRTVPQKQTASLEGEVRVER